MRNIYYINLVFFLTFLSACSITDILTSKPKLTNVHKGKYNYYLLDTLSNELERDILDVNVIFLPIPKISTPITAEREPIYIFDLRDSLPHKLVGILAKKTDSPEELYKWLQKPIIPLKKDLINRQTDFTTFKARFMISNVKKYFNNKGFIHPNTRLEFLNTTTKITDCNIVEIVSLDKLENEYYKIDMGTLGRKDETTFNAKISGQAGKTGNTSDSSSLTNTSSKSEPNSESLLNTMNVYDENGQLINTIVTNNGTGKTTNEEVINQLQNSENNGFNLGVNAESNISNVENISENVPLKLNKPILGFSFDKTSFTITQRGIPFSDISNNVIVTATFKFKKYKRKNVSYFSKLFDDNNPISPKKLDYKRYTIKYIPCENSNPISFKSDYSGLLRVTQNRTDRGNNVLEYDDKVDFYKFSSRNDQNKSDVPKDSSYKLDMEQLNYCKNIFQFKYVGSLQDIGITERQFILDMKVQYPNEYTSDFLNMMQEDNPSEFLMWLQKISENAKSQKDLLSNGLKFFMENSTDHENNSKIYFISDKIEEIGNLNQLKIIIKNLKICVVGSDDCI